MFNWVLSTGNQIDFWCFFYCPKYLVLKESLFYVDARAAAYRGFLYIISRQRRKEKNMEIKNVLFAEALDAWLLCYGGKGEDVEYVGEWNRLARVLCKLALDDEFVEYARERGYSVDRQVAHARLYVNVFLLS